MPPKSKKTDEPKPDAQKFKRSTSPNCPECGVTSVAVSTPGEVAYCRCPAKGCGWTSKTKRELVVKVPVCPRHDVDCRLNKARGDGFMVVFVCPVEHCGYVSQSPKPGLTPEKIAEAEDNAAGVSAR